MTMNKEIRVLLADDHPIVRKGLRAILSEVTGIAVVAECADGESALTQIVELQPDVAVLDIDMPKLDGFGVVRELTKRKSRTKLIVLTLHDQPEMLQAAMDMGVLGYLLKDSAMLDIAAGVAAVAEGRPYLSSALTMRMLRPSEELEKSPFADLTPSERRILRLIADGQSSKEIGEVLSIHYRTVENHRTNICRKLSIEGSNALLRFALQHKAKI